LLLFADKSVKTVLVGGYDEMTPSYFKLLDRIGFWKREIADSAKLNMSNTTGALAGEGSISVMLSDRKNEKTYAAIEAIQVLYQPDNIETSIKTFLSSNGKSVSDIDLVLLGINGDAKGDLIYKTIAVNLFESKTHAWFKHLSGEFFSSAGFGLWLAANCIRNNQVPPYVALNSFSTGKLKNLLMVNHYRNKNYSLILFSEC
jgi:3-oxoacyl-[acyl-carrier-protein] synthase II